MNPEEYSSREYQVISKQKRRSKTDVLAQESPINLLRRPKSTELPAPATLGSTPTEFAFSRRKVAAVLIVLFFVLFFLMLIDPPG